MRYVPILLARRRLVLSFALALGLGIAGGLYWKARTNMLDRVMPRLADLPAGTPAISFVNTSSGQTPVHDYQYAAAGHYSVVVYHQARCPDCRRLDKLLERFVIVRRDVAIRKIDLGEGWSSDSVRRHFGRERLWWTPFIVVYDADRKQIAADDGSRREGWWLVKSWIDAELARVIDGPDRAAGQIAR